MATVDVLLWLAVAGLAGVTGHFLKRASRARREISQRLHDAAYALDQRCDVLQDEIRALDRSHRIAHLAGLVRQGEAEDRWPPDVTRSLRRHVLDLGAENFEP